MMSLGILSSPGALPLVSRLTQLSYSFRVNCVFICVFCGLLFSRMRPSSMCHRYFLTAHMHVSRWYVMSSQIGACLWNDVCWML